jgi:hypothetical protein
MVLVYSKPRTSRASHGFYINDPASPASFSTATVNVAIRYNVSDDWFRGV